MTAMSTLYGRLPGARDWLFSAKTFAASMLALYISLSAGLPRSYWAMATVFIVANPLTGATRSKAVFRVCGTVIGATGAIVFLPLLVDTPLVMSAFVAFWTGTFLFVSFFDRSPRSYLFMLSGYTLPLIALPAVDMPSQVFDIATARAIEIGIGITCTSLVHSLVLPGAAGPIVSARVTAWLADARDWLGATLRRDASVPIDTRITALTGEATALDGLIAQLAYDPAMGTVVQHARNLRARMSMLMPLASSLQDRLEAVERDGAAPAELASIAADLDIFLERNLAGTSTGKTRCADDGPHEATRLRERIGALEERAAADADWNGLLVASALERMRDLLDLTEDCAALAEEVRAGRRARQRLRLRMPDVPAARPHFDVPMLLFSAVSAIGATFAASLIWIFSGWSQGAAFTMIAAVACSFFATSDTPVPLVRMFIKWTVVATFAAGLYIFAILPGIHSFAGLVAVFAPPFIGLGLLIANPKTMLIGMLVSVNLATLMSIQEVYSADFESFANGAIATVGGGVFALVWLSIVKPFGAASMARRLVRSGWSAIAEIADARHSAAPDRFAGRVLDRLGQLVPRLGGGQSLGTGPSEVLGEMRIGLNVIELSRASQRIGAPAKPFVAAVLEGTSRLFAVRAEEDYRHEPDKELRDAIDAALSAVLRLPREQAAGSDRGGEDQSRRTAMSALVGLRLALFPNGPSPELSHEGKDDRPIVRDRDLAGLSIAAE